jgi:hypothetical protein
MEQIALSHIYHNIDLQEIRNGHTYQQANRVGNPIP